MLDHIRAAELNLKWSMMNSRVPDNMNQLPTSIQITFEVIDGSDVQSTIYIKTCSFLDPVDSKGFMHLDIL